MIEKEITIDANGITLAGTLCLPREDGRYPIVVMIHGSGPLDRNENMKRQSLDIFNVIAHQLAGRGFASFRYDKRGCGKSGGNYYTAGLFDMVDDAVHCIDAIQRQPCCDSIVLLGHSEGCIIAPLVSGKRTSVSKLVLICPFVQRIEAILLKQAAQVQKELESGGMLRRWLFKMLGTSVESQQELIDRIKSENKDTIRVNLQKVPAKSIRELLELDPPTIMAQVERPTLIIGGEKDLQCDPADVDKIVALIKGPVEAHVVKNLTHLLRFEEGEPALLRSIQLIRKPMEPVVAELIANWLEKQ
ncbi:MAG: alpha/beta fold hydrolase [Polyangiaceae bacterium]|nr:alpha/beta fold hydrolase [Polyangiaceae bacterium]